MIIKAVYQSGIGVLIDGFKALSEESGNTSNKILNYGAKSNTMFDHCKITFVVSDIRGVELIALKSLANKVKVLTENPFTAPKKMRPTIFSKEYPNVESTEQYKRFSEVISSVFQKNITLVDGLPEDIKKDPAMYMYNFAGSVSFDALVTFEGSNIVQLIGVFPGQGLKFKDGTWIDPDDQYFTNKAIAAFKKIYYDALEGLFGMVDIYTDVALEKLYFTDLKLRSMRSLDINMEVFPNVLFAQAINPIGSMDLISSSKPKTANAFIKSTRAAGERMDYIDSIINGTSERTCFKHRQLFLLENTTFIIYAQCTIQTLLMLCGYTNIVVYYTDMKNVLGVSDKPNMPITLTDSGVHVDGMQFSMKKDKAHALYEKNHIANELVTEIEREKSEILEELRRYQKERDFYEDNRFKNAKLRPPKSMIQRKEYYNMVPLYATTCCVLKFTKKDIEAISDIDIPVTIDGYAILTSMKKFYQTVEEHYRLHID